MKRLQFMLMPLIMLLLCTSCTASITGKIVDAETGQPIEGAILLVEWTKVHGFGNSYTSSEKAVEVYSDKNGVVKIPGYNDPTVGKPDVTVYKPGYVAWNNQWIFPDTRKRTDFEWKNNYVFKLERFKEGYSYVKHRDFITLCIHDSLSTRNKNNFIKAYEDAELDKWRKE